jgi:hypothetical protein
LRIEKKIRDSMRGPFESLMREKLGESLVKKRFPQRFLPSGGAVG